MIHEMRQYFKNLYSREVSVCVLMILLSWTVNCDNFHFIKSSKINLDSFHCFEGGTNFGFMNGGNVIKNEFKYLPTVTSYGM